MKLTINVIMMLLLFVCSATISAQTNEKVIWSPER